MNLLKNHRMAEAEPTRIQGFLFLMSEAYSYLCFTIYD